MANDWLLLFPEKVRALLGGLPAALLDKVEEVRVREGRPLEINYSGKYHFVGVNGSLTQLPVEAYKPDREDTHRLLDLISNHSLYTMEEELRKGFITIPGGHRIGLSGRTVLSGGGLSISAILPASMCGLPAKCTGWQTACCLICWTGDGSALCIR